MIPVPLRHHPVIAMHATTCRLAILLSLAYAPLLAWQSNILLIVSDDQGYMDLGSMGSPDIRTPRLDQLASEGVRLTSYYAAFPVCTPSRGALLTGRYPQLLETAPANPFQFNRLNSNHTMSRITQSPTFFGEVRCGGTPSGTHRFGRN